MAAKTLPYLAVLRYLGYSTTAFYFYNLCDCLEQVRPVVPFLDLPMMPFLDHPLPFLDLPLPFLDLPPPFLDRLHRLQVAALQEEYAMRFGQKPRGRYGRDAAWLRKKLGGEGWKTAEHFREQQITFEKGGGQLGGRTAEHLSFVLTASRLHHGCVLTAIHCLSFCQGKVLPPRPPGQRSRRNG